MNIKEQIRAEIVRLIGDKTLCSTTERNIGAHTALLKLTQFLDSLPEQPEEGLEEAARHVWESWNGGTMFDVRRDVKALGNVLNTRKEQPVGKTCKTCGFYENNCPYIRGKLIPYPNKVCKDYTYSVMKAQAQLAEGLNDEIENYYGYIPDDKDKIESARHFAEWGAEHLRDTTKMIEK